MDDSSHAKYVLAKDELGEGGVVHMGQEAFVTGYRNVFGAGVSRFE